MKFKHITTIFLTGLITLFFTVSAFAGVQFIYPKFQAFDNNGDPLSGGKLYTFAANSSTAKSVYHDKALTTPWTPYVLLDSRGEAVVYGTGSYKFVLYKADGTLIWTFDYLDGIGGYLGGNFYFPDAGQADQGAAVGSVTVKDFVDAIGAAKKATIVFSRGSTGNTTDYIFLNSETIPSNINCQFEQGARVSIAITKTLTLPSPNNIIAQPNQHIFTGSGTISWTKKEGTGYPEWWGAIGDLPITHTPGEVAGATDDTTAIQAAIDSSIPNLKFSKFYKVTGLYLRQRVRLIGEGRRYTVGIYGTGIASHAYTAGYQAALTDKYVIQNYPIDATYDGSFSVFDNIMVLGAADCVAYLQQFGNVDGYYSERPSFYGSEFNAGEGGAIIENMNGGIVQDTAFYANTDGTVNRNGLFLITRPTTGGAVITGVIQKVNFTTLFLSTGADDEGYGFRMFATNIGQIRSNIFNNISSELVGTGFYVKGQDNTFIGCWVERSTTEVIEEATSVSNFINCYAENNTWWSSIAAGSTFLHGGYYIAAGMFPLTNASGSLGIVNVDTMLGYLGNFAQSNSQLNTLRTINANLAHRKSQVETSHYFTGLTSADFTNVYSVACVNNYQTMMLEIEVIGMDVVGTSHTYFLGKRLIQNENHVVTYATLGTDITDATSDITLTNSEADVTVIAVKALAANTDAIVRIRVVGGGFGDASGFGVGLVNPL